MQNNIFLYIAIMVGVTTLIRVLPLTLIRKEIKNVTLRSFLYYIPYVTLAVMTFPAILDCDRKPASPPGLRLSVAIACGLDGKKPVFCVVGRVHCACLRWNCSCAEIDLNDKKLEGNITEYLIK